MIRINPHKAKKRSNKKNYEILFKLKNKIEEHENVEKVDILFISQDEKNMKKYDLKTSTYDTFKIILKKKNDPEPFTITFHIPTIINNIYIHLNGVYRIPIIQAVAKNPFLISDSLVIIKNSILKFRIKYSFNNTTRVGNYYASFKQGKINLLPILVWYYGGFKEFIEKEFGDYEIKLTKNMFSNKDVILNYMEINGKMFHMHTPQTLKDYYKFFIFSHRLYVTKNKNVSLWGKGIWDKQLKVKGKDVISMIRNSNYVEVLDEINMRYFLDAFHFLSSRQTRENSDKINMELKAERGNLTGKIMRMYENMFLGLMDVLYRIITNPNLKSHRITLTTKNIITKTLIDLFMYHDKFYNILGVMYELNKVSILGIDNDFNESIYNRVIHSSYKYKLDPITTPDRKKCGLIHQIVAPRIFDKK